jgi:hypothetical protein
VYHCEHALCDGKRAEGHARSMSRKALPIIIHDGCCHMQRYTARVSQEKLSTKTQLQIAAFPYIAHRYIQTFQSFHTGQTSACLQYPVSVPRAGGAMSRSNFRYARLGSLVILQPGSRNTSFNAHVCQRSVQVRQRVCCQQKQPCATSCPGYVVIILIIQSFTTW